MDRRTFNKLAGVVAIGALSGNAQPEADALQGKVPESSEAVAASGVVTPTDKSANLTQQSIRYFDSRKLWLLSTDRSSYAMQVGPQGQLEHVYWGPPLSHIEDFANAEPRHNISAWDPHQMFENQEYPGWGGPLYEEPALKITRENGDRDLVLRYVSHRIQENNLRIDLADIRDPIEVTLHYRTYPNYGIIRRSAVIRNHTADPFTIESAQSASWYLPPGEGYQLTYLSGRWAAEDKINHEPIYPGMKVLESRQGITSHELNPWFAIDAGNANEESGGVWFGGLAWSGNWRITVEQTPYQQVRVTGGFNTFDFAYPLRPGEVLETPEFFAGFSSNGFGGVSRLLHRFECDEVIPGGAKSRLRPVLYNSLFFDENEAGQKSLADKAAKLGVELFVMDDGWFRNRNGGGLGDWQANPKIFPNELKPVVDHVNSLGMDFGLWVEPEMVNTDTELYRKHPDWVMYFPGRPRSKLRNQLVLNLALPEVRDYIFNVLDKLVGDYNIKYFKWDMNRPFLEPGWPQVAPNEQKKVWVLYVRALYDIMDRLRAKHPGLEIEGCAGGGGCLDLGILRRVDVIWPSDNTGALDQLRIQEGFTQAYSPKLMSVWVTDVPGTGANSIPLQFRFLVAMQGALGISVDLNHWPQKDMTLAAKMIAFYKHIRRTVQLGNLYRVRSPRFHDIVANQYVALDGKQVVMFVFRQSHQLNALPPASYFPPTLCFRGLEPLGHYRINSIDGKLMEKQPDLSGAYLMRSGVHVDLQNDYDSTAIVLDRI